jgi:hypothetical protein
MWKLIFAANREVVTAIKQRRMQWIPLSIRRVIHSPQLVQFNFIYKIMQILNIFLKCNYIHSICEKCVGYISNTLLLN